MAEAEATIEAPAAEEEATAGRGRRVGEACQGSQAREGEEDKDKGADSEDAAGGPSVAAHPRAVRAVGRAKGWGALIGFMLGGYESLPTHTVAETLLRALISGPSSTWGPGRVRCSSGGGW